MKNIIIAQTQGKAVAVGDNNFATIKKAGVGNFLACLEVLKEILSSIPTEASETVHIYLPDMLQGITTGSAIEYVKSGKTGSGKDLSPEEIAGFKEFYEMYAQRILNVRVSLSKYIKKDATALLSLRNNAWKTVNSFNAGVNTNTAVATTIVDPNAELKAMIDKQILEALTAGNMEQVMTLTTYKNSLPAPTVVANTVANTNSVAPAGSEVVMPTFDDEADQSFNNATSDDEEEAIDENGNPITFDEEIAPGSEEQVGW